MIKYSKRQNLFLALRTLFKRSAKRPAVESLKNIVAIFLTPNIGDMIFATPVFHAIKTAYPEVKLTVIGSNKNQFILEGNPDIDTYVVCPDTTEGLISEIKKTQADYGFSLSASTVDIASLVLAGVPSVGAFFMEKKGNETLSYKMVLPKVINIPFSIGKYYAQEYLKIIEPIGIHSTDTRKRLFFTNEALNKVEQFLQTEGVGKINKIAVFSPGAGTKIKQWPAERFASVADYISTRYGYKVAVIGGPKDVAEVDLFTSSLKEAKPLRFFDSSLDELKAFISKTHMLLANDSGPVYIAEAFDVPTLVVVGPTDENEHPPKGERNRIVSSPTRGKAELTGHLEGFDRVNARRQIEEVTVPMVIKELDSLIEVFK